jgi:hypothetical protein
MTDINPQWRIECLTEAFGPCGIGWGLDILETEIIDAGADPERMVSVRVRLWYRPADRPDLQPGEAMLPGEIFAYGGSKLVSMERDGPYFNDEAFKMATTDAFSTACKHLGIAADIYAGLWDGSKYTDATENGEGEKPAEPRGASRTQTSDDGPKCPECDFPLRLGTKWKSDEPEWYCYKKMGGCGKRYDDADGVPVFNAATVPSDVPDDQIPFDSSPAMRG